MAFCFKRKESVAKAIRRLGRDRIEDALECLKDCRQPEAIHCARKEIKKTRAVLRLVRTKIRQQAYCRQTELLREAADDLSFARDAYVNAKALRHLVAHFKGQLTPGALRHVRAALRNIADEELRRFSKEKTGRSVQRILRRVARKLDDLSVKGKGWKTICPGVKCAYADGLRSYRAALENPTPENFHEWRKRAKDLWYQVSLLRPVWPEQMEAMADELETLGEYLGDDHDLTMLREAVRKQCGRDSDLKELKVVNGLIEERQRDLRAAALSLGARFYAEKPAAFCNRLRGYWRIWRRKKKAGIPHSRAAIELRLYSNRREHYSRKERERQLAEVREKLTKTYGIHLIPPFRCDFRAPWGNRLQVVDLRDESLIWLLLYQEVQKAGIRFGETSCSDEVAKAAKK